MARGVFVDATSPTYTDLNDAFAAPKALVYNSANISIAVSGTPQALTFDTEVFDNGSMHSTSVNTSRITIPAGGTGQYLIFGLVRFAANATGYREVSIRADGVATLFTQRSNNCGGADQSYVSITATYGLVAGQYLELMAAQSSGGALNAIASGTGTAGICFGAIWKCVA